MERGWTPESYRYGPSDERGTSRYRQGSAFGLGPRGFRRSDDKLYDDVCTRLTEDPLLDASDIQVDVRAAEVILRGLVDSREAKRHAEDIAEDVVGVADVRNELRVKREGQPGFGREARGSAFVAGGRTVAGVFEDFATAQRAIEELRTLGIDRDRISLVTRDSGSTAQEVQAEGKRGVAGPAGAGALLGGIAGGALGWLLGLGAITIPGLGPVIAAGAIVTALGGAAVGAAAGGLVGALVAVGIPETEARDYERRIREGGVLVTVSGVSDDIADRAKGILERHGGREVRSFEGQRTREFEPTPQHGNGEPATARR